MIKLPESPTLEHKKNALATFIDKWYGAAEEMKKSEWLPQPDCPPLLKWWYRKVHADKRLVGTQNEFCEPEKLEEEQFIVYQNGEIEVKQKWDGWVFWAENQGVLTMACEQGEDPVVWTRSDWPPTYTNSWLRESAPLSDVLIRTALLEAIYGAEWGGNWGTINAHQFECILNEMEIERIPIGVSEYPADRIEIYASEKVIAAVKQGELPEEESRIIFGAKSRNHLGVLEEIVENPFDFGL